MADRYKSIAMTALATLAKASAELDEAERLLLVTYGGTEKWVQEVEAWKRRKDAIIDCSRNT